VSFQEKKKAFEERWKKLKEQEKFPEAHEEKKQAQQKRYEKEVNVAPQHYYDVYQYSVNHTRPSKIVAMRFEDEARAKHFIKTRCKTKVLNKDGRTEILDYSIVRNGEKIDVYANNGLKTTVGDDYDVILKRFLEANEPPELQIIKNDAQINWQG